MTTTPEYLVARIYLKADPLVPVMQVVFDQREGAGYAYVIAGAIVEAMHDTSGQDYDYSVHPAIDYPGPLEQALRAARDIAAEHRP